ncbi:MAG: bifunctional hydroxymethylpyrimidine kinase/phosphomethylpyrimidine kinase [Hyphomicrobiaceae bacterium]
MARIIAVSSQVASGHVGLSAMVPVLQALGHDVIALPTVLLSNHPGHAHVSGVRIAPEALDAMVQALDDNGWLENVAAVVSGYLPSPDHVAVVARLLDRAVTNADVAGGTGCRYVCDPVLGDQPKGLYIDRAAALALKDLLLPRAHEITPNAFELGWLAGFDIATVDDATHAASVLGRPWTTLTSLPDAAHDRLLALRMMRSPSRDCIVVTEQSSVPRRDQVPHGTGDAFAAALVGLQAQVRPPDRPLACVMRLLSTLVDASVGRPELALTEHLPSLATLSDRTSRLSTKPQHGDAE